MPQRWLLVGAMGSETAPLLALLRRHRPRSRRLVIGQLSGSDGPVEVGVLTCGVGPDKAHDRTAAALARWRPDRVLNLGTCGALTAAHPVGTVLHVQAVLDDAGARHDLPTLGGPAVTLATVRSGVWDPDTREALAARGAAICEMEAAGVLAACRTVGLPLHAAKVVSDLAGGAPDPALPAQAPHRPGPVDVAVFKARALRLSERHLAPLARRLVATAPGAPLEAG